MNVLLCFGARVPRFRSQFGAFGSLTVTSVSVTSPVFVTMNSKVAVIATQGDYAQIADGGWVYAAHLASLDAREPDYVGVAERFLHTPYLWGGKTSLGIDCSGLTQAVLAAAGIKAPRDTDMQERELGTAIAVKPDLSGLRRGDLVFWKGHVGIMTDGFMLLHANTHHMAAVVEPVRTAVERIARAGLPISSVKRLRPAAAGGYSDPLKSAGGAAGVGFAETLWTAYGSFLWRDFAVFSLLVFLLVMSRRERAIP